MDKNFDRKQQFAHKLNEDLSRLEQQWRQEGTVSEIDRKIDDIRQSAKIILDRTEYDLARMAVGSPYDAHQEFFVGLANEKYTPRIKGTSRSEARLNSSHSQISYAVFCLKKKK